MSSVSPTPPGNDSGLRFWWVREGVQTFGPYTGKQMLAFLLKGRIRPATPVRPETEPHWRPASEDPEFARYFAGPMPERVPVAGPGGITRRCMPDFLIIADGGSCPAQRMEAVIGELGPSLQLSQNVWLLQCGLQLEKIRTYLARQLASAELLFIVDTRTRSWAGHNCAEGLEDRLRELIEAGEADGD